MSDKKAQVAQLPISSRAVSVSSFDEKKRTAQMIFSTGAQVRRSDWFTGERWIEELSLDPAHIRLDRIRSGAAPFLKDHAGYTVDNVLGRIVDASADGEKGIAEVRFSKRAAIQETIDDIRDGILPNVSVGYRIHKMEKVAEQDGVPVLRAVDWEPYEISSVAMPADAGAHFRGLQSDAEKERATFPCEIIGLETRTENPVEEKTEIPVAKKQDDAEHKTLDQIRGEPTMSPEEIKAQAEKEAADRKRAEEAAKLEGVKAERARVAEIQKAVRAAGLTDEDAEKFVRDGAEIDAVRSQIIDTLAARQVETRGARIAAGGQDETETRRKAVTEALLHRGAPETYKVTDMGRSYHGLTLLETCREVLRRQGVRVEGMAREEIARRSMHSTSDFPEIVAAVVNKSLRDAFALSPQTFAPFVRRVQNPDFKQISRVQLGTGTELKKVLETGKIEHGTVSEAAEKYSIDEYAKAMSISRKTLINDDMDAFVRLPADMGRKARSLESKLVYAVLTDNALMADGIALFALGHANLAAVNAAINIGPLGIGRGAMRAQKDIDGEPLTLSARYLLVPSALETVAEQYISAIQPQQGSNVNPFGPGGRSQLGLIVEPRLDASSVTAWYLLSGLDQIDMIELATLTGSGEPEVMSEEMFDSLGMSFRVVHSVGAKAIDHRGMFKNLGA